MPSASFWRTPSTALTTAWAAVALFVATALQPPAPDFRFDAEAYWSGARALVTGGDVAAFVDLRGVRGVLTPLMYVPAALFGDEAGPVSVLLENSMLVAVLGAVILPRLVAIWCAVTATAVWTCAGLCWLVAARFAPYPLVDLWAATLCLAALAVLGLQSRWSAPLAGALAGVAFNIRPSYGVVIVGLVVAIAVFRRWHAALFAGGVGAALLPQLVCNLHIGHGWSLLPPMAARLSRLQLGYAPWVVRYDTAAYADPANPQRFSCAPSTAGALEEVPGSLSALITSSLDHLPRSVLVYAEKVAAAVHWPVTTPYGGATSGIDWLVAIALTATTFGGALIVIRAARPGGRAGFTMLRVGFVVVWAGSIVPLVTTATETRFALPIVLLGVVGWASMRLPTERPLTRSDLRWVAAMMVLVVTVVALARLGLAHPAPAGPVTLEVCAAT